MTWPVAAIRGTRGQFLTPKSGKVLTRKLKQINEKNVAKMQTRPIRESHLPSHDAASNGRSRRRTLPLRDAAVGGALEAPQCVPHGYGYKLNLTE